MKAFLALSALAVRPAAAGVTEYLGGKVVAGLAEGAVAALARHFTDHSQRLALALRRANERAWKALEVALAGESLWERCKVALGRAEDRAFRDRLRAFLDAAPAADLPGAPDEFRRRCLDELREARRRGLLDGAADPLPLAEQAAALARFDDPQALLDAEAKLLEGVGRELDEAGFPHLARLLALRPSGGSPLLATAARYFFRRAVEEDAKLAQGLAFARVERLGQSQEQGFAGLDEALSAHGQRLEEMLGGVRAVVVQTHATVLDLRAQLEGQGEHVRQVAEAVLELLAAHKLQRRELRAGDSLSLHDEGERRLVRQLVERYRALPEEQRRQLPALLNAVGKVEVVAGNFTAAERDFREVATLVADPEAQGEAHFNRYRAALERRQWGDALAALRQAAELAPERFAPFPLGKYEPERILGAGGFGVVFLCRHRLSGGRAVLKTLHQDRLARGLDEVLREVRVLAGLHHPAIIGLRDCDFADAARTRPYMVMDYFEGQTLQEHVEHGGPVPAKQLVGLARQVAEGLRAAHDRGVLHRDVKPDNLLVRQDGDAWQVKLIDFGLALEPAAAGSTVKNPGTDAGAASGIAGTVDYAAPEQMGRLKGAAVGAWSDVYGFARTCCYALFRTPHPTYQQWQQVPPALAELLGRCLHEEPSGRPQSFAEVLDGLRGPGVSGVLPPPLPVPAAAQPVLQALPAARRSEPRLRQADPVPPSAAPASSARKRSALLIALPGIGVLGVMLLALLYFLLTGFRPPPGHATAPQVAGPVPTPYRKEEIAKGLREIKSDDAKARVEAARRLAVTPVHADLREGVARALEGMLEDARTRAAGAGALGAWGDRESADKLLLLVDDADADVREATMLALAALKDERAAEAIAARLADSKDRHSAGTALRKLGPLAEEAVVKYAEPEQEVGTRITALSVLQSSGTRVSLPVLDRLAGDGDRRIGVAAAGAAATIRARHPDPADGARSKKGKKG